MKAYEEQISINAPADQVYAYVSDFTKHSEWAGHGLSVVKDNVALHGGSVQAASDGVNKGSEFTVRLPLPDGQQQRP